MKNIFELTAEGIKKWLLELAEEAKQEKANVEEAIRIINEETE